MAYRYFCILWVFCNITLHILFMPYVYSRPYVYSFGQIFQALRLFPAVRLFQTLEYGKNFLWKKFGISGYGTLVFRRQKCVIISGKNLKFLATVLLCNTSMDKMFVQQVNRVHTHVILQNFLYI